MPIGKIDELVQRVVSYVRARKPQSIDQVFDSLPVNLNDQILNGVLADLSDDADSLAWLCGYFASEINSSEDNDKLHKPITLLSKLLIKHGMRPFDDFLPYIGCRLTVFNTDKFALLPIKVQAVLRGGFDVEKMSNEDFGRINDALLGEMEVTSKKNK